MRKKRKKTMGIRIYKTKPRGKRWDFIDVARNSRQAKSFFRAGYGGYKEIRIVKVGKKGGSFPYSIYGYRSW